MKRRPLAQGQPQNAYLECPGGHTRSSDEERVAMVWRGEWRPTAPFKLFAVSPEWIVC